MNASSFVPHIAVPPTGRGRPVLIVHSWWGLTASFTHYADRLADRGIVAGCVDLYGGETALDEGAVRRLRSASRPMPVYRMLQSALDTVRHHPASTGEPPGLVGFSMGGHWAIWLTQHPPPDISAVVVYYAVRSGDFTASSVPMMAHFAGDDTFVSDSARRRMEQALRRSKVSYVAYDYPGTSHWFAESDHPAFDRDAADAAFERTSTLLATS